MKRLLQIKDVLYFHDWKVGLADSRAHLSPPVLFSGQKSLDVCVATAKSMYRAISNAFVLNCELFTQCSHDLDNNSSHRVALVFVDILLQNNLAAERPLDLSIG